MDLSNNGKVYPSQEGKPIYRGEIYYVENDSYVTGSEYAGSRPGIIISNDMGNNHSSLVIVVYLTTKEKKPLPTHVKINSAIKPSIAMCEHIATVHKSRLGNYVGQVTQSEMVALERAIGVSLDLDPNIKVGKYMESWAKAYKEAEEEENLGPQPMTEEPMSDSLPEKSESKSATKQNQESQVSETQGPTHADDNYQEKLIELQTECRVYKELYFNLLSKLS